MIHLLYFTYLTQYFAKQLVHSLFFYNLFSVSPSCCFTFLPFWYCLCHLKWWLSTTPVLAWKLATVCESNDAKAVLRSILDANDSATGNDKTHISHVAPVFDPFLRDPSRDRECCHPTQAVWRWWQCHYRGHTQLLLIVDICISTHWATWYGSTCAAERLQWW